MKLKWSVTHLRNDTTYRAKHGIYQVQIQQSADRERVTYWIASLARDSFTGTAMSVASAKMKIVAWLKNKA